MKKLLLIAITFLGTLPAFSKFEEGFEYTRVISGPTSAIVTETFNTEFVQLLGNLTFNSDSISLSPNPTSDIVTITNNNSMEKIAKVSIYDLTGKSIYTLSHNSLSDIQINFSHFARGIYLVEIVSDDNFKIPKKLLLK